MNIIITGSSRGIGFEIAKRFAELDKHNIIAISRNEAGLNDLKNACIRLNIEAHLYPFVMDLEKIEEDGERLLNFVQEKFTEVDILINNAGYLINKPFEELSAAEINRLFTVNSISPIKLIQLLAPLMRKSEIAHTVNISSMGGFQGSVKFPGLSVYSASKAAIANITECLAEEYKETNLKFNCLALGAVQTEMLQEAFPGYEAPLKASEMAEYIVDFARNNYRFHNGKIIPVSVNTP